MKKYLILFPLFILAISCKKNNSEPAPETPPVYNNVDEANKGLSHSYNVLSDKSLYGSAYVQFTEMASDDVTSKLAIEDTDEMNWSN